MTFYSDPPPNEPAGGMAGWAVDLIDTLGGPGIAVLSALDNMFSVIPIDLVLPLVGYSATQGAINIFAAIAWATAGSVAGSLVLHTLGARLGRDRARTLLTKIPGIKAASIDRAETWFARHGAKAVVFGRMLPGIRTLISLPAGVERMPLPKFVLLTTIGSLMWNSTLLVAGYLLGDNWHKMTDYTTVFQYVLIALVAAAAIRYVFKRRGRSRREQATATSGDSTAR